MTISYFDNKPNMMAMDDAAVYYVPAHVISRLLADYFRDAYGVILTIEALAPYGTPKIKGVPSWNDPVLKAIVTKQDMD